MSNTGFQRKNLIPNQPLRDAYVAARAAGVLPTYVCEHLGWNPKDTSRLHRRLGLVPTYNVGYGKTTQTVMDRGIAVSICKVLGLDFDELYSESKSQKPAAHCKTCGDPMLRRHRTGQCGWCLEEIALFGHVDYPVAA